MNKKFFQRILFFIFLMIIISCKKKSTQNTTPPIQDTSSWFAKGADISWVTQMENAGRKFYNNNGSEQDLVVVLKSLGMNAIRLRIWVNPTNSWNNKSDVIAKAIRAKNAGMKIMIDFHYSDTWADPGHQTKPAAWNNQDFITLKESLSNHTYDVLNSLKLSGITPDWVQIGNETNDGMLWPDGRASNNMSNFAALINEGYNTTKSVFPTTKVIVHLSNGYDNNLYKWIFDGLKLNGASWDVIGLSLYPSTSNWNILNTQCLANMNDLIARYNTEVMVVEVGMSWDEATSCKLFLEDLIIKTKSISNKKGLGVLYWKPQAYNNWQGYTLGAFDNFGKPTIALNAFK